MPIYTNAPPTNGNGYGLCLMRTPANGKLVAIITSTDLVGCPTHWYGGRTVPCETDTCKACNEGIPWRWHAYISAILSKTNHHVLLEFTAQAAEQLIIYRNAHGTLRGCTINARRHRNLRNGRVILETHTAPLDQLKLPREPNITKALSIIWNIAAPTITIPDRHRDTPTIHIQKQHEPT